ncbi:MAG: hypothetical protein WCV00_03845 [Verrucomicrobiia bacterium]|jgi:hypothetical protein
MIRSYLKVAVTTLILATSAMIYAQDALPNDSAWSAGVDLMRLIDPAKDRLEGQWSKQEAKLITAGDSARSKLQIPFHPPKEYDFRTVFTRASNTALVIQIFSQSEHVGMWLMENGYLGFAMVNGQSANSNPTTVANPGGKETSGRHTSILQVRRRSIKAYLDGKLVNQMKTDYSNLSLHSAWEIPNHRCLGLATVGPATFEKIDLIEVMGKGSATTRRK